MFNAVRMVPSQTTWKSWKSFGSTRVQSCIGMAALPTGFYLTFCPHRKFHRRPGS